MRRLAAPAAIVLAPWLIFRLCYIPFHCNLEIRLAEMNTKRALLRSGGADAVIARAVVGRLKGCLGTYQDLVNGYMVTAANLRILKRPKEAFIVYQQALTVDRRPEIYLQMGGTLMELGDRRQAVHYFALATNFNPQYIYDRSAIPPEVWEEVYRRFVADEELFRNRAVVHPSRSMQ